MADMQTHIEGIESALRAISPDIAREEWVKVAMSLKSALGDDGLVLFNDWSKSALTHDLQPTDSSRDL